MPNAPSTPDTLLPPLWSQNVVLSPGEWNDMLLPLFTAKRTFTGTIKPNLRRVAVSRVVNVKDVHTSVAYNGYWHSDQLQMLIMKMAWDLSVRECGIKLMWKDGTTLAQLGEGEWAIQ